MTNAYSLLTRRKINPSGATGISTWYQPPKSTPETDHMYHYYTFNLLYYGVLLSRRRSCISPLQIARATCTLHPKSQTSVFRRKRTPPYWCQKACTNGPKVDVCSNRNDIIIAQDDSCRSTTKTGSFFVWSFEKLLYVKTFF